MPFVKGREKTGGRKPGVPDRFKLALTVRERLEQLGYDPILHMHQIATNPQTSPELREKTAADLLKYLYPALRSIEHSGMPGTQTTNVDLRHSILAAVADLPEEIRLILARRLIEGKESATYHDVNGTGSTTEGSNRNGNGNG